MQIEEKIKRLEDYLRNKKSILGFSAGSDSTLTVYTGAAGESPSPSLGSDGDIYIKVV